MVFVVGLDGTPDGWAAVTLQAGQIDIQKVTRLQPFLTEQTFKIAAIDIPIGLLDSYEIGGRPCDREARRRLRKRGSSVFPAPVRGTLEARSYEDACRISRASSSHGKALSKQAYCILDKIRETDLLIRNSADARQILREVHPELSFMELMGHAPMAPKGCPDGRTERRTALQKIFPALDQLEAKGRAEKIPIEDIFDAAIACWSAARIAKGSAYGVPGNSNPGDMTIWV